MTAPRPTFFYVTTEPTSEANIPVLTSDLSLRPTVIAGDRMVDDYDVCWQGHDIGRIRKAEERAQNAAWDWFVNPPLPIPSWCKGSEATLEEAKAAFRRAWDQFLPTLSADDLAHAWHHQDAARERYKARG